MPLHSYSQAEIIVTGRQRLEKPLLWMIWLGTISFSLIVGNIVFVIACSLAVGVNLLAVREKKELYVQRWIVNLGVLLATVLAVVQLYGSSDSNLETVGRYIVIIQLCKLFERKRSRDYVQLLVLNLLLVMTCILLSPSLLLAGVVLLYLVLACHVVMVFNLKRGLDTAANQSLATETGPMAPDRVAWNVARDWPAQSLRRTLLMVMIPAMCIGIGAFLLMPRAAEAMLRTIGSSLVGSQFGSDVRLGNPQKLYLSDRVVLHAKIFREGQPGRALATSSSYLRRAILSRYTRSTWQKSDVDEVFPANYWPRLTPSLQAQLIRIDVSTTPVRGGQLPTAGPCVDVSLHMPGKVRMSSLGEYALVGSPSSAAIDYSSWSFPSPLSDEARRYVQRARRVDPLEGNLWVDMPAPARQRVESLAREWADDLLKERERFPHQRGEWNLKIARRLAVQLRANYSYSLDISQADPTRDGVEDFLFYLKAGHCEYFASAHAVMCRLLSIPARLAVGFALSEYDPDSQQYTVRERDAHAWCEIYTPQSDWVIIDPTPGSQRLESMGSGWLDKLRDFFEELRFSWYKNVVGYDASLREDFSDQALAWVQGFIAKVKAWWASLKDSFRRLLHDGTVDRLLVRFLTMLAGLIVLVAGLILLGPWLRRRRRRSRTRRRATGTQNLPALQEVLAALARRGQLRRSGQTLREFFIDVAATLDIDPDTLIQLAEMQYRWRWGRGQTDRQDDRMGERLAADLLGQLARPQAA